MVKTRLGHKQRVYSRSASCRVRFVGAQKPRNAHEILIKDCASLGIVFAARHSLLLDVYLLQNVRPPALKLLASYFGSSCL